MPIDPSAVGAESGPVERSWTSKDALLYAGGAPFGKVGDIDFTQLVHGEQAIELAGPIPVEGTVRTTGRITGIYDKGKGAVIATESASVDAKTGEPRFTTRSSVYIRGAGGFGGERGPSGARHVPPQREPDHRGSDPTPPHQAPVYPL